MFLTQGQNTKKVQIQEKDSFLHFFTSMSYIHFALF